MSKTNSKKLERLMEPLDFIPKKNIIWLIIVLIFLAGIVAALAWNIKMRTEAALNGLINYQAKLTDASNIPVADGDYNLRFRLCTDDASPCASPVWTEARCYSPDSGATCDGTGTDQRVNVSNGFVNVLLGQIDSLLSVDFNQTLYLEISVGGLDAIPAWETLSPTKKLATVPSAFEALNLGGRAEDEFLLLAGRPGGQIVQEGLSIQGTTDMDLPTYGPELLTSAGWTVTAGWTESPDDTFTHTNGGGTTPLSHSTPITTGTRYQITYTVTNRTTGSVSIAVGGRSIGVTSTGSFGPTAISNVGLTLTPTTTFDGTIVVSMKEIAAYGPELIAPTDVWTSAGWTGDNSVGWDHTTGNTSVLSHPTVIVSGTKYQIIYTVTGRTAGSFAIAVGGLSIGVTSTGAFGLTATSTAGLTITPTTDFDGAIVVSIKTIAAISSPIFALLSSEGETRTEVRANAGLNNIFIGNEAGRYNSTGTNNSILGSYAFSSNTTGSNNSTLGLYALSSNTTGSSNSALGRNALFSNISGFNNSAMGASALFSNTTGSNTSAMGASALFSNTTGVNNTAVGSSALFSNTTGSGNTAMGRNALFSNITGVFNTAVGSSALSSNTGTGNSALGNAALFSNTTGLYNSALGNTALFSNTTGLYNSAMGFNALYTNTTGTGNSALGAYALYSNTTGIANAAIGYNALRSNTTGSENFAVGGLNTLYSNTTGYSNSALGNNALYSNTTGYSNLAMGNNALYSNTIGIFNFALGLSSLRSNVTGSNNIAQGANSLYSLSPTSGAITAFADSSTSPGVKTTVTSASHGLLEGATDISITGTTNYNGTNYTVTNVTADTFDIVKGFIVNDATGRWSKGNNNLAIGSSAGYSLLVGSGNVFLGNQAGYWETGSNKLFIDNQQRTNEADARLKALVYGVFDALPANQYLTINGQLQVSEGDIYVKTTGKGVIIRSPDDTCYRIIVDNSGILDTETATCP